MKENTNAVYTINNTIFADDNAVLKLMYILETGHTEFFMALYDEKYIFKATIHRLENGRYQLKFSIPESFSESIDIDDFFKNVSNYSRVVIETFKTCLFEPFRDLMDDVGYFFDVHR